jgi:hypothetical protein
MATPRSETTPMLVVGLDFQSFVFPNEEGSH